MPTAHPSLDLMVEVAALDGSRSQLAKGNLDPGNVPAAMWFRTRRGDGFAEGGYTLSRAIDRDYPDVALLNDCAFVGASGDVAYEGRQTGSPRTSPRGIDAQLAGWMSHAKDRKFQRVYLDRSTSNWQPPSITRQGVILTAGFNPAATVANARDDSGLPGFLSTVQGQFGKTMAELVYDARGAKIARILVGNLAVKNLAIDANLSVHPRSWATDSAGSEQLGTESKSASSIDWSPGTPQRFAVLHWDWAGTPPAGTVGTAYGVQFANVCVIGDHGQPLTGSPLGVLASDVIKDLAANFCPMLNTAGVQATGYPITHLPFLERTFPYDGFLSANRFHRWNLGVWESKTLTFSPVDLTDYDWEIRADDAGVDVKLQGDSTGSFANGIAVTYTDVQTGSVRTVTPDDYSELQDANPENPANKAGYPIWTELELGYPTDLPGALQIGRASLAEFNQPKSEGTVSLQGWVRDRAGHWQPAWKVRAGDRVSITSSTSLSDRPRLVQETEYRHDGHALTFSIDTNLPRLDAFYDRVANALAAANLTNP